MITAPAGFMVIGLPVPQGDLTCRGGQAKEGKRVIHKLYHSNDAALKPWREKIEAGARKWFTQTADEAQPLEALFTWSLPRPNSHYGTGRNADILKPSAPPYPTSRPDVDKLTRAVFDALTKSKRIHDDAQIIHATVRKRYATGREVNIPVGHPGPNEFDVLPCPGLVVRIYPIGGDDD